MKYIIFLIVATFSHSIGIAQNGSKHDSTYYDFWEGNWHQVIEGEVSSSPRFEVIRGLYPSSFEEKWHMEGYEAKALRGWDSVSQTWEFVWISELGHFQIWHEKKVDSLWYMVKTFVIDGEEVLSRQAFIPQSDTTLVRTSEHSRDGGKTWTFRFKENYFKHK